MNNTVKTAIFAAVVIVAAAIAAQAFVKNETSDPADVSSIIPAAGTEEQDLTAPGEEAAGEAVAPVAGETALEEAAPAETTTTEQAIEPSAGAGEAVEAAPAETAPTEAVEGAIEGEAQEESAE